MLGGCQLQERKSTLEEREKVSYAAKTTADVVKEAQSKPPPPMVLRTSRPAAEGKGQDTFEFQLPGYTDNISARTTSDEGGRTTRSASFMDSITWPVWIAIIGTGVGLLILLYAITQWRKAFKTVDLVASAADSKFASLMDHFTSVAASSTDAKESSVANAAAAAVAKARANVANEVP